MERLAPPVYETDSDSWLSESYIEELVDSTSSSEGLELGSDRIIGPEVKTKPCMLEGGELLMVAPGTVVPGFALVYFFNYYFNPSSTFYPSFGFPFH